MLEPELITPAKAFKHQVAIRPTRDITGRSKLDPTKQFHFNVGKLYFVDEDTAVEWLSKGYALRDPGASSLREPTAEERKKWASEMTTLRPRI